MENYCKRTNMDGWRNHLPMIRTARVQRGGREGRGFTFRRRLYFNVYVRPNIFVRKFPSIWVQYTYLLLYTGFHSHSVSKFKVKTLNEDWLTFN